MGLEAWSPRSIHLTGDIQVNIVTMTAVEEKDRQRRLEDTTLGCQLATLAILDDDTERLQKESFGFWHKHAILMITDTFDRPQEWKKGLTHVLQTNFGLETDEIINIHGWTPNHRVLDLQGYIAHNDEMVVIAYQSTASLRDNIINIDFLSSTWQVDKDGPEGYAGRFSALEGRKPFHRWRKSQGNGDEPPAMRVHTGFYNNFLAVLPSIQQHVESLIGPDQPPRKVLVCGYSLGGAIATLTGIYLWQQYDWNNKKEVPQHLSVVAMATPRPCETAMARYLNQQLQKEERLSSSSVSFIRVQRNKDLVPHLPMIKLGFEHFPKAVTFLTRDNTIKYLGENDDDDNETEERMMREADTNSKAPKPRIFCQVRKNSRRKRSMKMESIDKLSVNAKEKEFWEKMQAFPLGVRDHMPGFYLAPFRTKAPSKFTPPTQLDEEASA